MTTVKDILDKKGRDYWYISPQNTVFEALQLMALKNIGALMVIDKGKLVGMFSERDYARKLILKGFSSKESKVADFMSKELVVVPPTATINECMALMSQRKVRHLPVLDKDKIEGIVSIGDIVNSIIEEQNIIIKNLENYILGTEYY